MGVGSRVHTCPASVQSQQLPRIAYLSLALYTESQYFERKRRTNLEEYMCFCESSFLSLIGKTYHRCTWAWLKPRSAGTCRVRASSRAVQGLRERPINKFGVWRKVSRNNVFQTSQPAVGNDSLLLCSSSKAGHHLTKVECSGEDKGRPTVSRHCLRMRRGIRDDTSSRFPARVPSRPGR